MRNILIILLFFSCFQLIKAQTPLSSTEAAVFKAKVVKTAATTKTIISDFTQYKHLSFLNNDIETRGKLVFKTPNAIKWEYTSPYKYVAIFKDNSLKINDDGNTSNIDMSSNKMFKNLNELIINSVKGNMFDEQAFIISYFKLKDDYVVKFIPKDKSMKAFIASFELTFDTKTNDVITVKMIEPSKDYTKISFKNKVLNTPVNDAVFNN